MTTVSDPAAPSGGIAIVAATLRLPGAASLDAFWDNLLAGRDCVHRQGDLMPGPAETSHGVPAGASFVPAYGRIGGATGFDNERFGMSAAEALSTDPQQRLLLELVETALHSAAIQTVGRARAAVFVGCGANSYEAALRDIMPETTGLDDLSIELGTARDYAAGKIAYWLGTKGCAVNVLTACSTALVAVHLGCQSLLAGECDLAIAGVAAISFPPKGGYWAVPGSISAPDGVCRPFDVGASGTVPADGAGVVILKRTQDALAQGDDILCVIRGSAMNNDGKKPGFAHVSASAQQRVVADALEAAGVGAEAICYVEAHGTGTRLGDAVEWSALRTVFGHQASPVYVGSVKANIGHTRECAGLASLLKAALCLRHGLIPPTPNVSALPRDLDTPDAMLRLVTAPVPMPGKKLASVSAFGLGGTNCHVVLEAAPQRPAAPPGPSGTILLSSHGPVTLAADLGALTMLLDQSPDFAAGLATRSQRRHHRQRYRRVLVQSGAGNRAELSLPPQRAGASSPRHARPAKIAFAFPGVGSEYIGMTAALARRYPIFADSRDAIAAMAASLGIPIAQAFARPADAQPAESDLRRLFGRSRTEEAAPLQGISVSHLALFAVQIALVDLLASTGLRGVAVVGHSIGEFAAAVTSGVLSRHDAVRLIVERARLIEAAPAGLTLAVAAGAAAVSDLMPPGLALTADNSVQSCAVAGPREVVEALEARLIDAGIAFRRLGGHAAFHHPKLAGAAQSLRSLALDIPMQNPRIPMVSSVTGNRIAEQEMDASYWERQLLETVRFRQALATVASLADVVVEIGPGNVRPWTLQATIGLEAIRTCPLSFENGAEVAVFEQALAGLWLLGHDPDWPAPLASMRGTLPADPTPALRRVVFDPRAQAAQTRRAPPSEAAPASTATSPRLPARPGDVADELAATWCALIGLPHVAPDDDFFALGGDSLLGRHLMAMVRHRYGVEIPGPVLFASARLDGMAAAIQSWIDPRGRERA